MCLCVDMYTWMQVCEEITWSWLAYGYELPKAGAGSRTPDLFTCPFKVWKFF